MRRETWLAAAGYLCLFASGFSDNARGPLFPRIIDTFRVSDTECSLLVVIGCVAGLPGSLFGGALVARSGPRATMRAAAALTALGIGLVAAAGWVGDFRLVPLGAAILGLGLGGLGVVSNACIALAAPPEERGKALAALHVTYAVASLIVPLAITVACGHAGWPFVMAGVALVPLAVLPLSTPVPVVRVENPAGRAPLAVVLPYAFALSCFVVAEVAVSVWVVLYAKRTSTLPGPILLAGFFVALGTARALGGFLLRREHLRGAILAGALLTAAVVLLGLHVTAGFLPLTGLTVGILFPATITALTLELPAEQHGPAIGAVSGAYSIALAVAHAVIGYISDHRDLRTALHVSPLCAVVGAVAFAAHTRRRKP